MSGVNRRSMTTALRTGDLPPDMLAFVKEGTPRLVTDLVSPGAKAPSAPIKSTPTPIPPGEPTEPMDRNSTVIKPKPDRARHPVELVHKVNLSIRVPTDLTARLLRASTDRKLSREHPATQQEIVTEAVEQWLKRNGY